jgi:hypothetical protein|tara:strand:- start:795 stop:1466 length:672 start_codon:yes stop_codon:yes gene_type:complete
MTDLLILGDSFCRWRETDKHWPFLIENEKPRGVGFSGCSWWSVRKYLLGELKLQTKPKTIIFCHTEASRIPHQKNLSLNYSTVNEGGRLVEHDSYGPKSVDYPEIIQAAKKYYAHLHDPRFAWWTNNMWYKELDEILLKEKIEKVIHLYSFDLRGGPGDKYDYSGTYKFKKGVTIIKPLIEYVKDLKKDHNHLPEELNIKLGLALKDIINTYPGDGVRLNNVM